MVVVRWGAGVVSLKNTQYGNYIIASCPNKQSKREQEWIEKNIEWTNVPKFSAPSFFPISSPFFTCAAAWANAWASGFDAAPFMYLLIKYIQKSFNLKFIECNPNCNLVVGCFASFMQKNLKILVEPPPTTKILLFLAGAVSHAFAIHFLPTFLISVSKFPYFWPNVLLTTLLLSNFPPEEKFLTTNFGLFYQDFWQTIPQASD